MCYELRISLLLTFFSTLTWIFGVWWVSLLRVDDFSSIAPLVVVILFVLAKSMRSFSLTVASAVLLLYTSAHFPHHSSILLPSLLCSLLDNTFIVDSWLTILIVFLWKLPFLQLALALLLLPFLLFSRIHRPWRHSALFLLLTLSVSLQSPAIPSFSFAHLTQLLSFLVSIESRCCSATQMILAAALLITCNQSPLSGMFHHFSLWTAVFAVFARIKSSSRGYSVLHGVILLVMVVLGGLEALHDVRIARSSIQWRLLWSFSSSIRSEIRRVREYVESHSLQDSLFSLANPDLLWSGVFKTDGDRQLWGSEDDEVFFRNLPFSHVLLSPFDESLASCMGNDSSLYCVLKNRLMEQNSYGLCLNVLPFVFLEYASSDSAFLIYALSHFCFCCK